MTNPEYSFALESDCKGRWHWNVRYGLSHGPLLHVGGFFQEYGYGRARSRNGAEKAARRFIKLHRAEAEKRRMNQECRASTREVLRG